MAAKPEAKGHQSGHQNLGQLTHADVGLEKTIKVAKGSHGVFC